MTTDNTSPEIAIERLKQKFGLYKIIAGTLGVAVISAALPFIIERSKVALDAEKSRRDFVAAYTELVSGNPDSQLAIVEYFAHVLPDDKQRELWAQYSEHLKALLKERNKAIAARESAEKTSELENGDEAIRVLENKIRLLDLQLRPVVPKPSPVSPSATMMPEIIPYDAAFIPDYEILMPKKAGVTAPSELSMRLDYVHWSGLFDKVHGEMKFVAANINLSKRRRNIRIDRTWMIDSRVSEYDPIDNDYFRDNDWDRGHLVAQSNVAWGDTQIEADQAAQSTFHFTNSSLQRSSFNRGAWRRVENCAVSEIASNSNVSRISVMTGPLYTVETGWVTPPFKRPRRVPSAFWKISFYDDGGLQTRQWIVPQSDPPITTTNGAGANGCDQWAVSLEELQAQTGLSFSPRRME